MSKLVTKIKAKKYWIIGILILVFLVGWRIHAARNKSSYTAAYTVANQDVRQSVLATGTVTSQSNLDLSFKSGGVLTRLNVAVGDKVRSGQVLAMLDEKDASAAINQANAAVLAAQANYDKLINGASSAEAQVAQAAVDAAQVTLDNAKHTYDSTIQQQNTLVAAAQSALYNSGLSALASTTNSSTVSVSISGTYTGTEQGSYKITTGVTGSNYTYSVTGLETYDGIITRGLPLPLGKDGLYVTFGTTGTINGSDTWTVNIPNTQSSTYITAYNAYQAALQTQNQALVSAQAAIDTAQAALEQQQAALNLKLSAARPEDVAAAQAQIKTAQAQLQAAQNQYSNNIITAPIDGVITQVDTKLGENVPAQKEVIVMLDQNSLHVESNISESSIAEVQIGQQIDMTMDAFGPDKHFSGQVLSIDPASTVVSGVINYRVVSSIPQDPTIKPGMTVNLVITIADKNDVMAVPNRLIRTVDNKQVVTILKNNQPTDAEIQTGLAGDTYTEITGGLSQGDVLVTTNTQ